MSAVAGGDASCGQDDGLAHRKVVDVHAHHVPPAVIAEARRHGEDFGVCVEHDESGRERLRFAEGPTLRPFFHDLCDVDDRILTMDAQGVDVQVLSPWTDMAGYHLPDQQGARWARLQNDAMADAVRRHPSRLTAMGTLPMQDVAQAMREMRYAVDKLGMRSFEVCTSVNGRDLDAEEFRPLWSLACDLDLLVFLHPPVQQIGIERMGQYFLNNLVGNPTETTLAAARLTLSGIPRSFPHVKCLLAHGGGFFPYQLGRLDQGHRMVPATRSVISELPSWFASWFFYDTILFNDLALAFLLEAVGSEQVVLGSDYPFEMCDPDVVARVRRSELNPEALASVLGETSEKLLSDARYEGLTLGAVEQESASRLKS